MMFNGAAKIGSLVNILSLALSPVLSLCVSVSLARSLSLLIITPYILLQCSLLLHQGLWCLKLPCHTRTHART